LFNNLKIKEEMKKFLLSVGALSLLLNANAQNSEVAKPVGNPTKGVTKYSVSKSGYVKKTRGNGNNSSSIGTTTYDLQSNGSMSHRINNYGNGSLSAVWTFSSATDNSFADRGTAYNSATGGVFGVIPTTRQESFRTGFPDLAMFGTKDYFFTHNSLNASSFGFYNSGVGTSFTQQSVLLKGPLTTDTLIWPKAAIAGNNMYVINAQSWIYDTFRVGVFYSKSTDGGLTWPTKCIPLPGIDTASIYRVGGESYNISAKDSHVSIIIGDVLTYMYLLKSADYGTTFAVDTIIDCGLPANRNPYRYQTIVAGNGGGGPDTAQNIFSSDASASVMIDDKGITHVIYSPSGGYIDSTLLAGGFYRPITFLNTLVYWNSNMVPNQGIILDSLFDCDGNSSFDFGENHNSSAAKSDRYAAPGSSNFSQMARNGDTLYCVYSAVMDGDTTSSSDDIVQLTGQNFRDIFMIMSTNNGASWGSRINISNSPKVEDVFPSIATNVDNKVHIIWQSDTEPGTVLSSTDDQGDGNSIRYIGLPVSWLLTHSADGDYTCYNADFVADAISNLDKNGNVIYNIYPNPSSDVLNIEGNMSGKKITIANSFGQAVNATVASISNSKLKLDIAALPAGMYVISISDAKGVTTQKFVKN
jgi:hypothetical protein